jgi:hypothetical protein
MDQLVTAHWPLPLRPLSVAVAVALDRGEPSEAQSFVVATEGGWTGEAYGNPLEAVDSAAHRWFAEHVEDAETAAAVATELGFLGEIERVELADGRVVQGEPVELWLREAAAMRRALALWTGLQRSDLDALREDPQIAALASGVTLDPENVNLARFWDSDAVLGLARFTLSWLVNERLGRPGPGGPLVSVMLEEEAGRIVFRNRALTLLAALWLQLALAINGNKDYRRCPVDGRWWEETPDIGRTNRVYCSAACKQKAWRARRDERKGSRP